MWLGNHSINPSSLIAAFQIPHTWKKEERAGPNHNHTGEAEDMQEPF